MDTLGIFVKLPTAGTVKTRLAAKIGDAAAARLYAAFIEDLIARFAETADRRFLCYAPATKATELHFRGIGGQSFQVWPQPACDLGERMASFMRENLRDANDRVVIIGSDSPTLPRAFVHRAFDCLRNCECILGPATDGGYYLVGQSTRLLPIFGDVPWSTPDVLAHTIVKLRELPAKLALLPPWYDVDSWEDCQMLAGHIAACDQASNVCPAELQVTLPATRACLAEFCTVPSRLEGT